MGGVDPHLMVKSCTQPKFSYVTVQKNVKNNNVSKQYCT